MATIKSKIGRVVIPLLPVNRRAFDILRHESRALGTTIENRLNPFAVAKLARLRKKRDLSINIGSGGRGLPNWTNIELRPAKDTTICLDVRRKFPFADGSAKRIFAEHIVEHLDFREDIPRLFNECRRILKPQSAIRVVVPDAERFVNAYAFKDRTMWQELGWDLDHFPSDIYTPMHAINHIFHQSGEHLFAYDFETLEYALRQAGFQTVLKQKYQVSIDPDLAIDQEHHRPYSLYVEAVKE